MRAVVQRVARAHVSVDGAPVGAIDGGLCVLLAVAPGDTDDHVRWLAEKVVGLRVFEDEEGKLNLSVQDVSGSVLVVSQFTLYGDCRKGRRPSFVGAAPPDHARDLYGRFMDRLREMGIPVESGTFQAHMLVEIHNDGPVTLIVDTPEGL